MNRSLIAALALMSVATAPAVADSDFDPTEAKLEAAIAQTYRSDKNRARDDNRDPVNAMAFCRLRDDMTVIEFGPGAGWYTELLGPVLQEKGRLLIANQAAWLDGLDEMLARPSMTAVEKLPIDMGWDRDIHQYIPGDIDYGLTDADLALNIREYHNFDAEGASVVNGATFKALKPGGYYCVIDHTRRHMEPENPENGRRADPVQVILEVQAAGFRLIGSSNLFFKPDDELRYEVGRKTVTGNTDRFSLLFRKPE